MGWYGLLMAEPILAAPGPWAASLTWEHQFHQQRSLTLWKPALSYAVANTEWELEYISPGSGEYSGLKKLALTLTSDWQIKRQGRLGIEHEWVYILANDMAEAAMTLQYEQQFKPHLLFMLEWQSDYYQASRMDWYKSQLTPSLELSFNQGLRQLKLALPLVLIERDNSHGVFSLQVIEPMLVYTLKPTDDIRWQFVWAPEVFVADGRVENALELTVKKIF